MMASIAVRQPAPLASDAAAPDFVVVDVETACSRVGSTADIHPHQPHDRGLLRF